MSAWRSIDESVPRRLLPKPSVAAPPDPTVRWMEVSAIWLMSLLTHALLGFFLVMFYLEARREAEPAYSVTIWRDARGKDAIKIGAPEEGPPSKGVDLPPEPPKKEEPPKAPPPPPEPAPPPIVEPVVKAP